MIPSSLEAIDLVLEDYAGRIRETAWDMPRYGMHVVWAGRSLVVRGSDDWLDFIHDGRFLPGYGSLQPKPKVKISDVINPGVGDSGRWYHRGFLAGARTLYDFISSLREEDRPTCLIGHSYGGAVASIVGASMEIPAICFASPRPLFLSTQLPGASVVMNWCRRDDPICYLPRWYWGFRHIGDVTWIGPSRCATLRGHSAARIKTALQEHYRKEQAS